MVSGKESTFLGWESIFLGIKTTLFGRNLKKLHFWVVGSSVGVLFLFYVLRLLLKVGTFRAQYSKCHPRHFFISRSSVGGIRQGIREGKELAILIKSTFLSFGVLWSFLGSSLVHPWSLAREDLGRYMGIEY